MLQLFFIYKYNLLLWSRGLETINAVSAFAALHPAADVRCVPGQQAARGHLHTVNRPPHVLRHQFAPCHHRSPRFDQQHWWEGVALVTRMKDETCVYCSQCCLACRLCTDTPAGVGGVSVNVPQFFVPPADSMSQVSVMDLGAAGSVTDPCETRQTVSLPKMSRESLSATG